MCDTGRLADPHNGVEVCQDLLAGVSTQAAHGSIFLQAQGQEESLSRFLPCRVVEEQPVPQVFSVGVTREWYQRLFKAKQP